MMAIMDANKVVVDWRMGSEDRFGAGLYPWILLEGPYVWGYDVSSWKDVEMSWS